MSTMTSLPPLPSPPLSASHCTTRDFSSACYTCTHVCGQLQLKCTYNPEGGRPQVVPPTGAPPPPTHTLTHTYLHPIILLIMVVVKPLILQVWFLKGCTPLWGVWERVISPPVLLHRGKYSPATTLNSYYYFLTSVPHR